MKIKLLLLTLTLTLLSCDLLNDEQGLNFKEESFTANYTLWKESNINNYKFTQKSFSSSTGPMPEVQVEVENSKFKNYIVLSESTLDERDLIFYKTIDEIYEDILRIVEECKESINDPDDPMLGADIQIEFDQHLNYPVSVSCVGTYKEDWVGGLSLNMEISDLIVE